jgi:cell division protein YceG involved in septum cleavage
MPAAAGRRQSTGYLYSRPRNGRASHSHFLDAFRDPSSLGAREILRLLHDRGAIGDENLAMAYLLISGQRKDLKAGEYLFDRPVTTHEVVETLVKGSVYLHKFTVPEGLTLPKVRPPMGTTGFWRR